MKEGYEGVGVFYFYYAVISLLARPICHLKSKTGRLIFLKIKDFRLQILDGKREIGNGISNGGKLEG